MKHIIVTLILMTSSLYGVSQGDIDILPKTNLKAGIKLAFGNMSLDKSHVQLFDANRQNIYDLSIADIQTRPSFGIYVGKEFGWLFGNVNLLYSSNKIRYSVASLVNTDVIPQYLIEQTNTIDAEITGGIKFNNFKVGVGPVLHFLAGYQSNIKEMDSFSNNMRDIRMGFMTSVGYQYKRYSIDCRYEAAFWGIGDNIKYGYRRANFSNNPHIISLGISYALLQ